MVLIILDADKSLSFYSDIKSVNPITQFPIILYKTEGQVRHEKLITDGPSPFLNCNRRTRLACKFCGNVTAIGELSKNWQ